MTSYIINHYNGTSLATVADGTANTSATSLTLIGHALTNYGTALNENFVYLLENFSGPSASPPTNPTQGQLWWDSTAKVMNVYNGTAWVTISGQLPSLIVNSSITASTITTSGAITASGTISAPTINAGTIGNTGATLTGALSTAAQTNITSIGTLTGLTVNGTTNLQGTTNGTTINATNLYATTIGNTGAVLTGTISTASQTNITKVGNLTGLTSSAAIIPSSNNAITLGNATAYWSTVYGVNFVGTSTTAQYADLAEKYLTDQEYPVGTVVMVGGDAEVTQHDGRAVRAVGVVSEHPAYMMNGDLEGGTYIALKGRVPVRVTGPVTKGQSLRGAPWGVAIAEEMSSSYTFAIAMETIADPIQTVIEAIIL